jgi:predicted  nucleic acid-binding Zn-ribbon protein
MFKMPSPDDARVEFHRLVKQRDEVMAKAKPARDAYDKKRNELAALEKAQLASLIEAMAKAESGLAAINQEISGLSRYLGGKTALPEHIEAAAAAQAADQPPAAE